MTKYVKKLWKKHKCPGTIPVTIGCNGQVIDIEVMASGGFESAIADATLHQKKIIREKVRAWVDATFWEKKDTDDIYEQINKLICETKV